MVHVCRFRKANRAAYEPLDPCPQIDMFARNFPRVLPNIDTRRYSSRTMARALFATSLRNTL
jgi:hypothetical protein